MKCTVPEISWHNRDPVLSVDFQYSADKIQRLATGGTDSHILIWHISHDENDHVNINFASDLTRHQKAVNIVRFSPNGEILASADDEAAIITWKLGESHDIFGEDGVENKENWVMMKMLRGHLEDIYDLSWSSCSTFLISGSVDNTAIMWDIKKGKNLGLLADQKGFVQGVAWDPQNNYVATLSTDRQCRLYNVHTKKIAHRIQRANIPVTDANGDTENKSMKLFHDDTLKTFCRRLTFTPDGELLITPAGILNVEDGKSVNTTYVFSRANFSKPALYLPSKNKYTIAVRCSPVLYELRPILRPGFDDASGKAKPWEKYSTVFSLPYRMVFAVASQDSILIYDTQQVAPIAHVSNCHYTRLSDLSWSKDGRILIVSSTDGYCSVITFEEDELGTPYVKKTAVESSPVTKNKIGDATPTTKKIVSNQAPSQGVKNVLANTNQKPVVTSAAPTEKNGQNQRLPKRVPFTTLSSPKSTKSNVAAAASNTDKMDVTRSVAINSDKQPVSPALKTLQPKIEQCPTDMHCVEDSTDFKLVLEPTLDEFSFQEASGKTDDVVKMDVDEPAATPKSAPRRIQLITLSKPPAPK